MLTQERANVLTKYLEEDINRTKVLFDLAAEDAAKKINESGYDFTPDELLEYGKALESAATKEELDAEDLEQVAGGLVTVSVGIMVACGVGGAVAGFLAKKW